MGLVTGDLATGCVLCNEGKVIGVRLGECFDVCLFDLEAVFLFQRLEEIQEELEDADEEDG